MLTQIHSSVGTSGTRAAKMNDALDVRKVQILLNTVSYNLNNPALRVTVNGIISKETLAAISYFQGNFVEIRPDGRVDPNGLTLQFLNLYSQFNPMASGNRWMSIAMKENGKIIREAKGDEHNPEILKYFDYFPLDKKGRLTATDINGDKAVVYSSKTDRKDETAWCAAFVHWVLKKAGVPAVASTNAKTWSQYGYYLPKSAPMYGAIVTVNRNGGSGAHVALFVEKVNDTYYLLGGNQRGRGPKSDKICIQGFSGSGISSIRWPYHIDVPIISRNLV